jgi:hypothetical protein
MTILNFTNDAGGRNTFAPQFCSVKKSVTLDADTEATLTVPGTSQNWVAIFCIEPGTKVWIANNETAEVPAGNTFADTTSEMNVPAKQVKAGDVLSFITADTTADVGVLLYAIS